MITNVNPDTGIRYGVISMNSIDGEVEDELFYGPQAVNLSERAAYEDTGRELELEANRIEKEVRQGVLDKLGEAASTTRKEVLDELVEDEIQAAYASRGYADRDDFIEVELERRCEHLQIEEPTIEGTLDGVKYRISWLGGAPLLWIIEGPVGYANRLCSPCVPNAADLDSGFDEANEPIRAGRNDGYQCYVIPNDWAGRC